MAIPGVCPNCGAKFDLHLALNEANSRRALAAALEVPAPLARLVVPYMALFSPAKRVMAMGKLERLLRELTDHVTSGQVTRNGITYGAAQELWKYGIEETLAANDAGSLILPLKDHNYLCQIVWSASFKVAGKVERDKEEQIKHRQRAVEKVDPMARAKDDAKAELVHMRGMLKNLPEDHPNREILEKQIGELEQKLEIKHD